MFKRVSGTLSGHALIRVLLCLLLVEQSLVNCVRNDLGAIVSDADQAFSEVIMLTAFLKSPFLCISLSFHHTCEIPFTIGLIVSPQNTDKRSCQISVSDQFNSVIACRCFTAECHFNSILFAFTRFKTFFLVEKQLAPI